MKPWIDLRNCSKESTNCCNQLRSVKPSGSCKLLGYITECTKQGAWVLVRQIPLLPLDGFGSAVPSFQLHPVFGAVSNRVPPSITMSCFIGFGDKSWDNSKNFFQTQGFEFLFLSQRAQRAAFGGSISPKTPVLKLNRPFARKPPATIASESTRAAFMLVEKPQVAALRRLRVK